MPLSQPLAGAPEPIATRFVGRIVGAAAFLVLLLVAAAALILVSSYRNIIAQEEANLRNLSFVFGVQTAGAMQSIDQAALEVQRGYFATGQPQVLAPDKVTNDDRTAPVRQLGFHNFLHSPLFAIYLYDRDRHLLAEAHPLGASGERLPAPHIDAPVALADNELIRIAVTDVDAATGHSVLNVSRSLVDPSGKVVGVCMARIDAAVFQKLYETVQLGDGGSVTLMHLNSTMLIRGPSLPPWIGKALPETPLFRTYIPAAGHGGFEAMSPVANKLRLYGYDVVEGYPLVVITGVDKATALHSWQRWLWTTGAALCMAILLVLFLAWRVAVGSARQLALILRLADSQDSLASSAAYMRTLLNAIDNPIPVLDGERRYVLMNEAFCRLAGMPASALVGRSDAGVLQAERGLAWRDSYGALLQEGGTVVDESDIIDSQGRHRTLLISAARLVDADGRAQIVRVLTDISERKQAELRLTYLADFDPLTGLPNLAQLRRALVGLTASDGQAEQMVGVLIVSLLRLQEINDLLGHEAADDALKVAARLIPLVGAQSPCVARIKNNEFALLTAAPAADFDVGNFAESVYAALAAPIDSGGREFYLGPVIGVATFPTDARGADELLRLADVAKHRAAQDGKEPIHYFSGDPDVALEDNLALEAQLRKALQRAEFRLVYQPKVEVDSGRIVGFEALLRWTNVSLGMVSPARFIPIAESTGLIVEIGAWVLEQACMQMAQWHRVTGMPVRVAVNLSLRQFHQRNLIQMIKYCIETAGIPGASLELEITESTVMSRESEVDRLMGEIRELGVDLSVDDFGTGYSSLAHLKRFPVQCLKIDRAFIKDLGVDEYSLAIARSIITLGHGLNLKVVAEGVETDAPLAILAGLGCDEFQGFLFSRPLEVDAVLPLLRAQGQAPQGSGLA